VVQIHVHVHNHDDDPSIHRKLDHIMADLTALRASVSQVLSEIDDAVAALADLSTKVAAGTVSQADIDAITATLAGAATSLDTAVDTQDPDLADTE